jgi:hypothetical protein
VNRRFFLLDDSGVVVASEAIMIVIYFRNNDFSCHGCCVRFFGKVEKEEGNREQRKKICWR